ncbi:hypothetical protein BJX76DRAFT_353059 [Aspergillus varians]
MASGTINLDTGSPGPSVQYDEFSYEHRHGPKFQGLSAYAEIDHLRRELTDACQHIECDTGLIKNLRDKVDELEKLVEKQKETIKIQSRTISDRRGLRKHQQQSQSPMGMGMGTGTGMGTFPMTPSNHHQHHVQQYQYQGSGASGVSRSGTGTGSVDMMMDTSSSLNARVQSQSQTPQTLNPLDPTSQYGTVFDQPPPKFEIPLSTPYPAYAPAVPPGLASDLGRGIDSFTPMGPTVSSGIDLAHSAPLLGAAGYHKEMANFSTRFMSLMHRSEIFGHEHASLPNIVMDSQLNGNVKEYLMAITSRTEASSLAGSADTRRFVVAKAINRYLIEQILSLTVINGFDASVDQEISAIQKQMTPKTPILLRHLMLTAIATHISTLSQRPNFPEFTQQKVNHHSAKLWQYIAPLGHHSPTKPGKMWTDFNAIIAEAQSLAVDMYAAPLEYRFEFPEQGEPFDPPTMILHENDPHVRWDPQVLQSSDARVLLGITPIVRIRNNSRSPGDVHLYMGQVLLNVSKRQGLP